MTISSVSVRTFFFFFEVYTPGQPKAMRQERADSFSASLSEGGADWMNNSRPAWRASQPR